MRKRLKYIGLASLGVLGIRLLMWGLPHAQIAVLSPRGIIAHQQRDLLVQAVLLMLLIVIPVFILTFFIAWKYRASNDKADYQPEWDHNTKLETLWWGFPCAIIIVLAVMAWTTSRSLDPFRPIQSNKPPLTIQVVALQWKWLFIYPEQQIASVNYVQFPEDTPLNFEITADAPMNSFWIPQLGGQIYAMAGMSTHLHLMADAPGSFNGSSANLSGNGFASMRFTARASTTEDFDTWVTQTKQSSGSLSRQAYDGLARPGTMQSPRQYASYENNLYDTVIMKYMGAAH